MSASVPEAPPFLTARWLDLALINPEHYWGYTAQCDGSTLEYKVEHPRWHVWKGTNPELTCDVSSLYGSAFAPFLRGAPSSCFAADGSAVLVRRGTICEAAPRVRR